MQKLLPTWQKTYNLFEHLSKNMSLEQINASDRVKKQKQNSKETASLERLQSGDGSSEDQRVHIPGALVGGTALQVVHVPHHVVGVHQTVRAEYLTTPAHRLQRLLRGVALDEGDHLRGAAALVPAPTDVQAAQQRQVQLGHRLRQLVLNQLIAGQWPVKLPPLEGVVARQLKAEGGRAEHAPGDADAGEVQQTEKPFETVVHGQQIRLRDHDIIEDNHADGESSHGKLASDLRCTQSAAPGALEEEAAQLRTRLCSRPDEKDVGDGRVGDPGLHPVKDVAV